MRAKAERERKSVNVILQTLQKLEGSEDQIKAELQD